MIEQVSVNITVEEIENGIFRYPLLTTTTATITTTTTTNANNNNTSDKSKERAIHHLKEYGVVIIPNLFSSRSSTIPYNAPIANNLLLLTYSILLGL